MQEHNCYLPPRTRAVLSPYSGSEDVLQKARKINIFGYIILVKRNNNCPYGLFGKLAFALFGSSRA